MSGYDVSIEWNILSWKYTHLNRLVCIIWDEFKRVHREKAFFFNAKFKSLFVIIKIGLEKIDFSFFFSTKGTTTVLKCFIHHSRKLFITLGFSVHDE